MVIVQPISTDRRHKLINYMVQLVSTPDSTLNNITFDEINGHLRESHLFIFNQLGYLTNCLDNSYVIVEYFYNVNVYKFYVKSKDSGDMVFSNKHLNSHDGFGYRYHEAVDFITKILEDIVFQVYGEAVCS